MDNTVSFNDNASHDAFIIIPSQRGGQLLLHDGYRYNFKRNNKNGHKVWMCSRKNNCPATLVENNSIIIKQTKHECKQELTSNEIKHRISKCIERAKNETTPVPSIYADTLEEMKDVGLNLLQALPKYDSVKKTIYKHRNKALQAKKIRFTRLKDVMVPNIYNNFLLADYHYKKSRILLFASKEGREIIKQAKEIYVDGTFKSATPPFSQLLSLHVDRGITNSDEINIAPAIYGLLPNKKQESYEVFFNLIKSQIPEFNPEYITTDFELGMMNAIEKIHPNSVSRGCLFHFSQAVWRHAKKHGLTKSKLYKAHVRHCIALSYVPIEYRNDGWLYILGECIIDPKTSAFNQYYKKTWNENKSCFANKWCFYKVKNKTNNVTESWNSRINKKVISKPNIAQLLKTLSKDSHFYETFWKKNHYISKRTREATKRQQILDSAINELVDHEITAAHCIDKLALCLC